MQSPRPHPPSPIPTVDPDEITILLKSSFSNRPKSIFENNEDRRISVAIYNLLCYLPLFGHLPLHCTPFIYIYIYILHRTFQNGFFFHIKCLLVRNIFLSEHADNIGFLETHKLFSRSSSSFFFFFWCRAKRNCL